MPKFNVQQCPVCDEKSFSPFLTCTDFFVSGEQFSIKQCDSCGFKITENIENEENIGRYYQSEEYISHSNTAKGLVNSAYHAVRKYMLGRKRRLVEKATSLKTGQILDVGTGTGFFLNEMKENGWQVTGTEKSSDARDFAKKEFNLDNLPSEELFTLKDKSFDVITLWHVLEHIHLLNENMETFHRLLNEKGKLIIAVPNHESFDAKHYREFWAAFDVPRHIWHFAPKQMEMVGEKHGFKLSTIQTMPFDSFYVAMLSEKYKKSKLALFKGIYFGKISWLNSILKPEKCSSVIYVFQKN
ncbi:MAG TPA: class I SAM-dependent methyltransferase [Draconibacterium sp.]|jgi:2-polyprenyl-3-methyl-5-hydroxy-6-metoxy-1,4-benzoquinol methylase|nr:class I SAM-dependent methyltransferase [Draconibacterium sp.]